jgi:hypothetical protein
MNKLPLWQVQQALYSKLNGDGVLMGMLKAIYDVVPETFAFPYMVIGDGACRDVAHASQLASEVRLEISIFSQATGRKQLLQVMDRVYGLLHHAAMVLPESVVVHMRVSEARTDLLNADETLEGRLQVRVLVAETGSL